MRLYFLTPNNDILQSEIPSSTGLMRACDAVGGVDVGWRDVEVDRLNATT